MRAAKDADGRLTPAPIRGCIIGPAVVQAHVPDARLGPDRVPEPKAIVLVPGRSASEGQTQAPFPCAVCRMRMACVPAAFSETVLGPVMQSLSSRLPSFTSSRRRRTVSPLRHLSAAAGGRCRPAALARGSRRVCFLTGQRVQIRQRAVARRQRQYCRFRPQRARFFDPVTALSGNQGIDLDQVCPQGLKFVSASQLQRIAVREIAGSVPCRKRRETC